MSIFLSLNNQHVFDFIEEIDNFGTMNKGKNSDLQDLQDLQDSCVNNKVIKYNNEKINICCNNKQLIKENGTIMCQNCGIINDILYDDSVEYNEDGTFDQYRTSIDPRFVSMSYATVISTNSKTRNSEQINAMRRAHFWNTIPSKEQTLFKSFNNIKFVCESYSIKNNIMLYAQNLMHVVKRCQSNNKSENGQVLTNRANNIDRLESACVYYACRHYNEQISELQVGKMFGLKDPKYNVGLGQQMMHKIIHKEIDLSQDIYDNKNNLIDTYCKRIKCPDIIKEKSNKLYEQVDKLNILNDHSQQSIAVGLVYFMLLLHNIDIPKSHVAVVCTGKKGATATIDKVYNKLVSNFSKLNIV
uniref:Transcription factor TFIIB cyclin-like domain-containing protein n=1 Tax=viral metagenome TaxID=1070528 RepID=A0A6C0J2R6_9ZZZZ